MAVLAKLADKHRALESEAEAEVAQFPAQQSQAVEPSQSETDALVMASDAAKNRAEGLLKICEAGVKAFVDPRLELSEEDIHGGRECMGPCVEKYDMAGDGEGVIPFQEEATMGFWLGGFAKRTWANIKLLRKRDREALKRQREQQQHGNQREYQSTEPAHPVPGAERDGQKPDVETEGWNSEAL